MAQDVTIQGASYTDVPFIDTPKTGGGTARFVDTTDADAVQANILNGKTAYVNGTKLTGSANMATATVSGTKLTLTDGFPVNQPSGSSWTLMYSGEVTSTNNNASVLDTITIANLWQTSLTKIIYVRIKSKDGKRAGYFYDSDAVFFNYTGVKGTTTYQTQRGVLSVNFYQGTQNSDINATVQGTTNGYGVFALDINANNELRLRALYDSGYSRTMTGTYSVKVYALDYPNNNEAPWD